MRALGGTVCVVYALINGDTEIPRIGYHRKVRDTDTISLEGSLPMTASEGSQVTE